MKPKLILGIGNILLHDEGVGARVIEAMRGLPLPDDVELMDGGTSGADLVDILAGRQRVVVVDAMQARAEPGTVMVFTDDDLMQQRSVWVSLHQLGLVDSLRMGRMLKCAPREVVIIGIQPADVTPGLELSPQVAALVPGLIKLALEHIQKPAAR